jgi:hypothetical protein
LLYLKTLSTVDIIEAVIQIEQILMNNALCERQNESMVAQPEILFGIFLMELKKVAQTSVMIFDRRV